MFADPSVQLPEGSMTFSARASVPNQLSQRGSSHRPEHPASVESESPQADEVERILSESFNWIESHSSPRPADFLS